MPRAPPSDLAAHAACSFENEPFITPEYEQDTTLQAPMPGSKVLGMPVRLPLVYPKFALYPPEYPFNVYCIYPDIEPSTKKIPTSVNLPCRYPWLYIYAWEYPHITPYPVTSTNIVSPNACHRKPALGWLPINVRLSPTYPTLDIYPPSYPWNLGSIYPPTRAVGRCALHVEKLPGQSDNYPESASLSSLERDIRENDGGLDPRITLVTCLSQHPNHLHFKVYSTPLAVTNVGITSGTCPDTRGTRWCLMDTTQRKRKTHAELHVAVSRSLEKKKQPGRNSKSHRELHEEVFEDRVVWSPSGSVDIAFSSFPKKRTERPAQSLTRLSPADLLKGVASGYARSRAAKAAPVPRSWEHIMTSAATSPAALPIYLPRVLGSGPPSPPALVVSESPSPRSLLHVPTLRPRWSEAMKSLLPGLQRSKPSKASETSKSHSSGN